MSATVCAPTKEFNDLARIFLNHDRRSMFRAHVYAHILQFFRESELFSPNLFLTVSGAVEPQNEEKHSERENNKKLSRIITTSEIRIGSATIKKRFFGVVRSRRPNDSAAPINALPSSIIVSVPG